MSDELKDLLIRIQDYMGNREDADNGVPNEEMNFYNEIEKHIHPDSYAYYNPGK